MTDFEKSYMLIHLESARQKMIAAHAEFSRALATVQKSLDELEKTLKGDYSHDEPTEEQIEEERDKREIFGNLT